MAEHEFSVSFDASIKKYDIDSLGVQHNVTFHDLLDVGIYTMATDGTDSLGYRMKHWFKRDTTPLTITIPFEPTAVKIDPMGRVMSLANN